MKKFFNSTDTLLVIVNILLLIDILGGYGYRALHYYQEFHKAKLTIADKVLSKVSYLDTQEGLVFDKEKETYTFKGAVEDNYLLYQHILYRIVGVDENRNLKLISEHSLTALYGGLTQGYQNSYVRRWLNPQEETQKGFLNNLNDLNGELVSDNIQLAHFDEDGRIVQGECLKAEKAGLLTLSEYALAGAGESYLANGEAFYLAGDAEQAYIVSNKGKVVIEDNELPVFGVRPTIKIRGDLKYLQGEGTLSDPYLLKTAPATELIGADVGSYLRLDDDYYRIVAKTGNEILVAASDVLKQEGQIIKMPFGKSIYFSLKNGIGKYLNTTFYESLSYRDKIVAATWPVGAYQVSDLDYLHCDAKQVQAKVALLSLGDLFLTDCRETATLNGLIPGDVLNSVNADGHIFAAAVTNDYALRPAFYLQNGLIIAGTGTVNDPYLVEE